MSQISENIEFSRSSKRIFFYSFYKHSTLYKTSTDSLFVFEPTCTETYLAPSVDILKDYILNTQDTTKTICTGDVFEFPVINIGTTDCVLKHEDKEITILNNPCVTFVRVKFTSENEFIIF
jgi:hypothetical protein